MRKLYGSLVTSAVIEAAYSSRHFDWCCDRTTNTKSFPKYMLGC